MIRRDCAQRIARVNSFGGCGEQQPKMFPQGEASQLAEVRDKMFAQFSRREKTETK